MTAKMYSRVPCALVLYVPLGRILKMLLSSLSETEIDEENTFFCFLFTNSVLIQSCGLQWTSVNVLLKSKTLKQNLHLCGLFLSG